MIIMYIVRLISLVEFYFSLKEKEKKNSVHKTPTQNIDFYC